MWQPGIGELLIILFIVLVIFGAGKLPQVGRSLGSAISEFKETVNPSESKESETTQNSDESEQS